jgi:multidrug efflux pump subunit AcrA (membrane-fusion protein)
MGESAEIIVSVIAVGVVILMALVGFAWRLSARLTSIEVRISQTEARLEARIDQTEARLGARIDQTEAKLEARIDQTEARLGARIDQTEAKLEARIDQTEARIDQTEARLEARIDQTEARLGARIDQSEAQSEVRFQSIEARLGELGAGMSNLNHQMTVVSSVLPTLYSFMHRGQIIDQEEYHRAMEHYTDNIAQSTGLLFDYVTRTMNPLTDYEATQLRAIYDKMRANVLEVTREEAVEFNNIVKKILDEHPGEFKLSRLYFIGWFLLGCHPGSYKEVDDWENYYF